MPQSLLTIKLINGVNKEVQFCYKFKKGFPMNLRE